MKRILHNVIRRGKKHHKKHLGFLKVLRFFEGMPLFGVRH